MLFYQMVPKKPTISSKFIIVCKFDFNVKVGPDDSIDKFKACLVAKGLDIFSSCQNHFNMDFLSLCISFSSPLHQLDINNKFLHGDLYGGTLRVCWSRRISLVCHMQKFLYDFKQCPQT